MNVLVTGGAGFIGSHLVDRMVKHSGNAVRVLDNLCRGRTSNLERSLKAIQFIEGDITNRTTVETCMKGVDLVYHMAALSNVLEGGRKPDVCFRNNVIGTYEVLRAAHAGGVRRVIFTSSREVYGEPTLLPVSENSPIGPRNAYGTSKAAGELYCRLFAEQGLDCVVFRLANVYGTRDGGRVIPLFIEKVRRKEVLTVFGSEKLLDFLWIENLLDVLERAATAPHPGSPVNLGSGIGTSLTDLAGRILRVAGQSTPVEVLANRDSEVSRFVADVSLARKLFGLHCPTDPLEPLPGLVESYLGGVRSFDPPSR